MIATENTSQNTLEKQILQLTQSVAKRDEAIAKQDQKITELEEQLAWFKRQVFGQRTEKIIPSNDEQLLLFDDLPQPPPAKEKLISPHTRRQPNRNGQDKLTFPSDIPIETKIIDLPESEKVCQETGVSLVKIGEEVSDKLAHKPGAYFIKRVIRPKYAHPQREEFGIVTAPLPESILPKCLADESLLAEIVTKKFADHLPLYRIAEAMGRESINISHKLLSQWIVRLGLSLKPLHNEMERQILKSGNVFIDEIPVKLQAKGKCKQAYIWALVGGEQSNPAYRIYNFRENRNHQHAFEILEGYKGVFHSDKYGAYQKLAETTSMTWCPCWSHIRRQFFEAETGDPPFRQWVLKKIRYLFMFERIAWARSPEERLKIRQEKEVPIIDELIEKIKARLIDGKILPKSKFRKALGYFCGLIPYLKNYIQNPFARLDNNVAERAVRSIAIGRKNWLFFGSRDGGEAGAILLSLVQTCRALSINPREYLEDIFRKIMSHNSQNLYELLPDQWLLNRQS